MKLGRRFLRDEEVTPHLIYIAMYTFLIAVSSGFMLLMGQNDADALAISIAGLGNVGPSIHQFGTFGSYNSLPEACKMVMTLDMFLGRVEIYPILAVLTMGLNRHARV